VNAAASGCYPPSIVADTETAPETPTDTPPAETPVEAPAPAEAAPVDEAIAAMERCLAAGDHHAARTQAEALLASDNPARQAAGRAMRDRLRPDLRVSVVFAVTGGLIAALALHWLGHRA
jgi:hypothetical protein